MMLLVRLCNASGLVTILYPIFLPVTWIMLRSHKYCPLSTLWLELGSSIPVEQSQSQENPEQVMLAGLCYLPGDCSVAQPQARSSGASLQQEETEQESSAFNHPFHQDSCRVARGKKAEVSSAVRRPQDEELERRHYNKSKCRNNEAVASLNQDAMDTFTMVLICPVPKPQFQQF